MKVWIVETGERYEGGSIVKVYDSYEKAYQHVCDKLTDVAKEWDAEGRELREPDPDERSEMYNEFGKRADDYWVYGCDFISIESHEVE